jgi:hypothetical protein
VSRKKNILSPVKCLVTVGVVDMDFDEGIFVVEQRIKDGWRVPWLAPFTPNDILIYKGLKLLTREH